MKLRIISKPDWLYGRSYQLQRLWFGFLWLDLVNPPYQSEARAKAFAEEYASGAWVSDSATFGESPAKKNA